MTGFVKNNTLYKVLPADFVLNNNNNVHSSRFQSSYSAAASEKQVMPAS